MRRSITPRLAAALAASLLLAGPAKPQLRSTDNDLPDQVGQLLQEYRYADALPLLRKLSDSGNQAATFLLANYFVCGKGVPFSCRDAEHHFGLALISRNQSRLDPETSRRARNEIAWIHASCEQPGFNRNLVLALKYAADAAVNGKDPYAMDTLAAVQARLGKFEAAAEIQKRALQILLQLPADDAAPEYTIAEFKARIALYERRLPARVDESNYKQNCNTLPDKP